MADFFFWLAEYWYIGLSSLVMGMLLLVANQFFEQAKNKLIRRIFSIQKFIGFFLFLGGNWWIGLAIVVWFIKIIAEGL